jgi:hypothetical protein
MEYVNAELAWTGVAATAKSSGGTAANKLNKARTIAFNPFLTAAERDLWSSVNADAA